MEIDPRLQGPTRSLDASSHTLLPPPSSSTASSFVGNVLPPLTSDTASPAYYHLQRDSQAGTLSPSAQSDGQYNGDGGNPADPKRPRACEACRGLKVRCDPDPENPNGSCKRCAKAGRNCVVTVPSRKRQKKTDSRVAELEKKIDALTASLQASKSARTAESDSEGPSPDARFGPSYGERVGSSNYTGSPQIKTPAAIPRWSQSHSQPLLHADTPPPPTASAGQKRKFSGEPQYGRAGSNLNNRPHSASGTASSGSDPTNVYPFLMPKNTPTSAPILTPESATSPNSNLHRQASSDGRPPSYEYADVIDRRVIDAETAAEIFERYVRDMAPHLPIVVFPPNTTAAEVRKTKPTLFLSILSAASGPLSSDIQRQLTKEVMRIFAERIICNGEKSLELVQALHVSTLWYWPPEHYEELKFYQLIHIAAIMAIDVGMGRSNKLMKAKHLGATLWRDHPWRRAPLPQADSVEARRAWLGCYILCNNAAMSLRRPNLIRWSSYLDECLTILETSPEAYPSDKVVCQWARIQHVAEEVGIQFSMDDPSVTVSITDPKVQYALKGFERQLEQWSAGVPTELRSPLLKLCEHHIGLYMHEIVMHADPQMESSKFGSSEDVSRCPASYDILSPVHINALSTCLSSVHTVLETFLEFDVETIRTIPIFHFLRVAYAVVVLMKLHFAVKAPNGELGKVVSKEHLKVEYYLDALLEIFRASAENEKFRPAAKFLMVLTMLKTWFQKQRDGKGCPPPPGEGKGAGGTPAIWAITTSDEAKSTMLPRSGSASAPPANPSSRPSQSISPDGTAQMNSTYGQASTPLHLLSEVAMGNSNNVDNSTTGNLPEQRQPSGWYQFNNTEGTPVAQYSMGPPPAQGSLVAGADQTAPSMMGDYNNQFPMGEFDPTGGLPFTDSDLSTLFMDDVWFNFTMDGQSSSLFDPAFGF